VALVYFGAAKFGLALAFATPNVTAIWPPTGIALAALILGGRKLWPGVALGAFLANVTTDVPLYTTLGITLGNTLEAVVGALLLERFRSTRRFASCATSPASSCSPESSAPRSARRSA
jgi:integral membrane sensor domain MASE1